MPQRPSLPQSQTPHLKLLCCASADFASKFRAAFIIHNCALFASRTCIPHMVATHGPAAVAAPRLIPCASLQLSGAAPLPPLRSVGTPSKSVFTARCAEPCPPTHASEKLGRAASSRRCGSLLPPLSPRLLRCSLSRLAPHPIAAVALLPSLGLLLPCYCSFGLLFHTSLSLRQRERGGQLSHVTPAHSCPPQTSQ